MNQVSHQMDQQIDNRAKLSEDVRQLYPTHLDENDPFSKSPPVTVVDEAPKSKPSRLPYKFESYSLPRFLFLVMHHINQYTNVFPKATRLFGVAESVFEDIQNDHPKNDRYAKLFAQFMLFALAASTILFFASLFGAFLPVATTAVLALAAPMVVLPSKIFAMLIGAGVPLGLSMGFASLIGFTNKQQQPHLAPIFSAHASLFGKVASFTLLTTAVMILSVASITALPIIPAVALIAVSLIGAFAAYYASTRLLKNAEVNTYIPLQVTNVTPQLDQNGHKSLLSLYVQQDLRQSSTLSTQSPESSASYLSVLQSTQSLPDRAFAYPAQSAAPWHLSQVTANTLSLRDADVGFISSQATVLNRGMGYIPHATRYDASSVPMIEYSEASLTRSSSQATLFGNAEGNTYDSDNSDVDTMVRQGQQTQNDKLGTDDSSKLSPRGGAQV